MLRYQYSNHLGTATLELDDDASVIDYEEYYPFGATSFQSGRSLAEVSLKRYRYTGKERDEETGLYYHGARYYAPWIARWTAVDPINSETYNSGGGQLRKNAERNFLELGASSYEYCYDNPARFTDPSGEQPPGKEDTATLTTTKQVQSNIPEVGEQRGVWYQSKKGMQFALGIMNREDFEKSEYAKKGDYFGAYGGVGSAGMAVSYRQDGSMVFSYGPGREDKFIPYKATAIKSETTQSKENNVVAEGYSKSEPKSDPALETAETVKKTSEIYSATTYIPGLANDVASSSKVERLINLSSIPSNYRGLSRLQQIKTVRRIFETTERLSKPISKIGLAMTGVGAAFTIVNAGFESYLTGTIQRSTRVDLAITLTFTAFAFIPATAPFFWG